MFSALATSLAVNIFFLIQKKKLNVKKMLKTCLLTCNQTLRVLLNTIEVG